MNLRIHAKETGFFDLRFFHRAGCPVQRQAGCLPLHYSGWLILLVLGFERSRGMAMLSVIRLKLIRFFNFSGDRDDRFLIE
jgi:hypothetical protein